MGWLWNYSKIWLGIVLVAMLVIEVLDEFNKVKLTRRRKLMAQVALNTPSPDFLLQQAVGGR